MIHSAYPRDKEAGQREQCKREVPLRLRVSRVEGGDAEEHREGRLAERGEGEEEGA